MKTVLFSVCLFLITAASLPLKPVERSNDKPAERPTRIKAGQADHVPVVAGYERFIEDDSVTEVERGLLLINELNCHSCHANDSSAWTSQPRIAPILSEVGTRVQAEYFEKFILNPHAIKPGTTMPNVLADLPEGDRKQVAESLAHFLASTGQTKHQPVSLKEIKQGETLYHQVGCVACHDPQNSDDHISTSIPHGKLSDKYTVPGLTRFLRNPLHSRPSGRMPQFNLKGQEIRSIAAYLLRDVKVPENVNFALYKGTWETLPNFDSMVEAERGTVGSIEISDFGLKDHFGVVYSGFWELEEETKFTFRLGSDDGSRLYVGDNKIFDKDGIQGFGIDEKVATIPAGVHLVRLEYFENEGQEGLECTVENEIVPRQSISNMLRLKQEQEPDPTAKARFVVDPAKAAAGRKNFTDVGCANCHELKEGNQSLTSSFPTQKALTNSDATAGCITGAANTPRYGLSKAQQASISAAIEYLKTQSNGSPNQFTEALTAEGRIHQQLTTLNCYACHSREIGERGAKDFRIVGGVIDKTGESLEFFGRDKWFTSTEAEMGDEGRLPPDLKRVGAKLNRKWFDHILSKSSKDRPYMNTYMPKFGIKNMPGLIDDFVTADQLTEPIAVTQTASEKEVKKQGRKLVGDKGLSCIKCHTFAEHPSAGVPAINMATMTRRLNKDWFQAYMRKPSSFRRGTRMPESWPDGKTFYPDMLDGDTDKQINAVWTYLSDGEDAPQPSGLIQAKLEIMADEFPRIYRNFIKGAGPRAIGVGYPESVNLAFDADNCRMALIWQENFMDGSLHWFGRGKGYQPPLGVKVRELPNSIGFFDGDISAWPTSTDKESARELGMQFKGYSFDEERRPTFLYEFKGTAITEKPIPRLVDEVGLLSREFTVAGGQEIAYQAATGSSITETDGAFNVDGLTITLTGDGRPEIVKKDKQSALIWVLPASDEPRTFVQQYDW